MPCSGVRLLSSHYDAMHILHSALFFFDFHSHYIHVVLNTLHIHCTNTLISSREVMKGGFFFLYTAHCIIQKAL